MKFLGRQTGRFLRFLGDRSGVSTVEYALIVVAVIAIVGAAMTGLSDSFTDLFDTLEEDLTAETDALSELGDDADTETETK